MANYSLHEKIDVKKQIFKNNSAPLLPPIQSPTQNLDKVLVLTKNDLERITNHINRRQIEQDLADEELNRKKELHEKSLALTRNWNNTIEGSRKFKLKQRKIREEKLEEKRRAFDLEHAELMAEERKKTIEQAKLLQYHETDRIKTFHSAMKYSEVLKEREAQLEMRKLKEKMMKDQEEELENKNLNLLYNKDKIENESYLKKKEEIHKLTAFHKKQIQEHMEKIRKEKENVAKEGKQIDEINEDYQEELDRLEKIKHSQKKELKKTYDKALESKKKMKQIEEMMEEEENDEIRAYANAKTKLAYMKRAKEDEISKEKQEKNEKMMAYLGSLLKTQVADEDFRIAKAVSQNEAKLAQEEYFKEMKSRKEQNETNQYRLETIKRKQEGKSLQQQQEEEEMKKKMETDLIYQLYEIEKDKQRKKVKEEFAKNNLKLYKQRKEEEKNIKYADRDFVLKELELMNLEDKQFETYAENVIDYMEKHGRNTIPMKKVVYDTLKRNQSPELKTKAAIIKKHQNDVPTNKNLGFNH